MMRSRPWWRLGARVLFLVGTAVLALPAIAQEETGSEAGLVERLTELRGELQELRDARESAADQRREALDEQLQRKQDELRGELSRLVESLDQDPTAARDRERDLAGELLEQEARLLRSEIEAVDEAIEELEASRPESADPATVEDQIRDLRLRLDRLMQELLENIEQRQTLGIDAASDLEWLDERLRSRAVLLSGVVSLSRKRIEELADRGASDEGANAQRAVLEIELDGAVRSLEAVSRLMERRGLDASEYRQVLLEAGQIGTNVLDAEVAVGLATKWWASFKEWSVTNLPVFVIRLILFVLILLIFRFLAGLARRLMRRAVSRSRLEFSQLMQNYAVNVAGGLVLVIGILIALDQLGLEIGPLLAGFGIAGFVVGFALQDTLSNFASGVMVLVYRPYDVGDVIEAGGVNGKVTAMNLVSTTILTFDNQKLVVPNNKIWGDVIRNVNAESLRRVDLVFGIGYDDDIEHAERTLREIVQSHDKVLADPEPVIRLHNLGDSSVDFIVRPWVLAENYWDVYWDVMREVKRRFDAEGISIPFPQRDVHLYQETVAGSVAGDRPSSSSEPHGNATAGKELPVTDDDDPNI